jgi:DNA/RNA-binding domain of Phe-tRNA-synthetase-like protein
MEIAPELRSAFPGLRVVELKLTGLTVRSSDPDLEPFKLEVQERVRRRTASLEEVKDQPIFRAYRDFFWKVGIHPTKTRPAGEALTRRILGGRDLPRVNTVVDAYNLVSVETSIAIAAFDTAKVSEDALMMRKATSGEPFHGIGMASVDSLSGGGGRDRGPGIARAHRRLPIQGLGRQQGNGEHHGRPLHDVRRTGDR